MLVGPLSGPERDALWSDYVRFGELFGMPREIAPGSHAEFTAYFNEQINRPEAHLTDEALKLGTAIMFQIPVPSSQRPAMAVHNLIVLGSLPPRIRELYGLRWTTAQAAAFRATVLALKSSRPLVPGRVRTGSIVAHFDRVARTEKTRAARGEEIPGALSPSAS
jgi:uncharacterized protein (DUF2236 family)